MGWCFGGWLRPIVAVENRSHHGYPIATARGTSTGCSDGNGD